MKFRTIKVTPDSQNPLALTVSWKWTEKIAQFKPVGSSLGIEEERKLESEVVVRDIVSMRFHKYCIITTKSSQCEKCDLF
jgi:hypothetical protein